MKISRKSIIIGVGAAEAQLRPTPQETFGPHVPVHTPRHNGFTLAHIPGRQDAFWVSSSVLTLRVNGIRSRTIQDWLEPDWRIAAEAL